MSQAKPKLFLAEETEFRAGIPGYTTKWYCEPPGMTETFMVIRDEWCHGGSVRKIFEIRIAETRRPVDVHDSQPG